MAAEFTHNIDIDGYFKKVIERSQKKINKAVEDAIIELFDELKVSLQDIYKTTIDEFYESYPTNGSLRYDRNYSLYDLIEFTSGKDELGWDFNEAEATSLERSYGTVFNLAFIEGWHGGAAGRDSRGNRSNDNTVSTPHWRYPDPYYTRWMSEPAERMTPSPYETWEERRTEYIRNNAHDRFVQLLEKHIGDIKWF